MGTVAGSRRRDRTWVPARTRRASWGVLTWMTAVGIVVVAAAARGQGLDAVRPDRSPYPDRIWVTGPGNRILRIDATVGSVDLDLPLPSALGGLRGVSSTGPGVVAVGEAGWVSVDPSNGAVSDVVGQASPDPTPVPPAVSPGIVPLPRGEGGVVVGDRRWMRLGSSTSASGVQASPADEVVVDGSGAVVRAGSRLVAVGAGSGSGILSRSDVGDLGRSTDGVIVAPLSGGIATDGGVRWPGPVVRVSSWAGPGPFAALDVEGGRVVRLAPDSTRTLGEKCSTEPVVAPIGNGLWAWALCAGALTGMPLDGGASVRVDPGIVDVAGPLTLVPVVGGVLVDVPGGATSWLVGVTGRGRGVVRVIDKGVHPGPGTGPGGDAGEAEEGAEEPGGAVDPAAVRTDPVQRCPRGVDDRVEVRPGFTTDVDVVANDVDPNLDPLAVVRVDDVPPGMGAVVGDARNLRLTGPRSPGTYRLRYEVTDGGSDGRGPCRATAVVEVEVRSGVENLPPTVRPDLLELAAGTERTVDVLGNDSDPDGDRLSLGEDLEVTGGSVEARVRGGLLVVSAPGTRGGGSATVAFDVSDGHVSRGGVLRVRVLGPDGNHPPVANPDAVSVGRSESVEVDVLANDLDPDGGELRVTGVVPSRGARVVAGSRILVEAPGAGVTRYRVTVADPSGLTAESRLAVLVLEDGVSAARSAAGAPTRTPELPTPAPSGDSPGRSGTEARPRGTGAGSEAPVPPTGVPSEAPPAGGAGTPPRSVVVTTPSQTSVVFLDDPGPATEPDTSPGPSVPPPTTGSPSTSPATTAAPTTSPASTTPPTTSPAITVPPDPPPAPGPVRDLRLLLAGPSEIQLAWNPPEGVGSFTYDVTSSPLLNGLPLEGLGTPQVGLSGLPPGTEAVVSVRATAAGGQAGPETRIAVAAPGPARVSLGSASVTDRLVNVTYSVEGTQPVCRVVAEAWGPSAEWTGVGSFDDPGCDGVAFSAPRWNEQVGVRIEVTDVGGSTDTSTACSQGVCHSFRLAVGPAPATAAPGVIDTAELTDPFHTQADPLIEGATSTPLVEGTPVEILCRASGRPVGGSSEWAAVRVGGAEAGWYPFSGLSSSVTLGELHPCPDPVLPAVAPWLAPLTGGHIYRRRRRRRLSLGGRNVH